MVFVAAIYYMGMGFLAEPSRDQKDFECSIGKGHIRSLVR